MSCKQITSIVITTSFGITLIIACNHWCNMREIRLKHENEMEEEEQRHLNDMEFLNNNKIKSENE